MEDLNEISDESEDIEEEQPYKRRLNFNNETVVEP